MGVLTSRAKILENLSKGKATGFTGLLSNSGTVTAANAGAGFFNISLLGNLLGTTVPTTYSPIPLDIPTANPTRLLSMGLSPNSTAGLKTYFLANIYRIGTVDPTSTGDKFTHDAATFPILKTQFGVANQPLSLLPFFVVTAVTATTAAVMRLRTAAGGAGYVDQDGNNKVGALTITLPNVATAAGSSYPFKLEWGDSAVQDITAVEVTTATSAGSIVVYGAEILAAVSHPLSALMVFKDTLFSGIHLDDLRPGVATSGSANSILALFSIGASTASQPIINLEAVYDA